MKTKKLQLHRQENLLFTTSVSSNTEFHIDEEEDSDDRSHFHSRVHVVQSQTSTPTVTQRQSQHTYVVAMSGGVDSSVAAAMLVHNQQSNNGHGKSQIVALHMSNWNRYDDDSNTQSCCTSLQDFHDVQTITQNILHIPSLVTYNDETTYWCHVFEPYIHNLLHYGMMGNPDIDCNTYVKFHSLLQHVLHTYGQQTTLVTGHYARLWYRSSKDNTATSHQQPCGIPESVEEMIQQHPEHINDLDWLRTWGSNVATNSNNTNVEKLTPLLMSARDLSKDQSYFLSGVDPLAFHHVSFPIGDYYKNVTTKAPHEKQPSLSNNNTDDEISDMVKMIHNTTHPRFISVREMAKLYQLKPVEKKRDSMGLCFIGNQKRNRTSTITKTGTTTTSGYTNFISNYLPIPHKQLQYRHVETNEIVYESIHPQHPVLYTPGQGMKVPGGKAKYFCVQNNYSSTNYQEHVTTHNAMGRSSTNREYHPITICPGTNHSSLYCDAIYVDDIHWLCTVPPPPIQAQWNDGSTKTVSMEGLKCRTRHLQALTDCTILIPPSYSYHNQSSISNPHTQHHQQRKQFRQFDTLAEEEKYNEQHRIMIRCHTPIRAVTPGQRVVFYTMHGLICLGSAVILSKSRSYYELGKSLPCFRESAWR